MRNLLRKFSVVLSIGFFCLTIFGCNDSNRIEIVLKGCEKITNATTINELYAFDFEYEFTVPGADLPFNYLIDGNTPSGETLTEEHRTLFTYLTEYNEDDGYYYLAYIKTSDIKKYREWLINYEKENKNNVYDYHFSKYDRTNIVDGKYFLAYQKSGKTEPTVKYFKTNDIKSIKQQAADYTLVFCAQKKYATIKQNVSVGQTIDKKISLYKRTELVFENENAIATPYVFDSYERTNQTMINEMFAFKGEMLEVYPAGYKDYVCGYYPVLGMKNYSKQKTVRAKIVVKDDVKYVSMPRYLLSGDKKLDLLNENETLTALEDLYKTHKKDFNDALIETFDTEENTFLFGRYYFALYDYDKVIQILKIKQR